MLATYLCCFILFQFTPHMSFIASFFSLPFPTSMKLQTQRGTLRGQRINGEHMKNYSHSHIAHSEVVLKGKNEVIRALGRCEFLVDLG